ncbi:Peroxisomal (S)-2-hydroxy-acid oxidase GLO3 [Capsicum annuum]|uniref:(S)-2-hydroxy-acid oxidase n=1 Tax=Capsicum annuum TaxID=4072 RepID=A0A2G2ZVR5_CAPAN|nr:Peroxisomal (S)-2-hydroxy-acid oxidase GLO3 [Capsicum annuum]
MAGEPVNVNEFQELARQALPKMYYDYYTGGAEDQHTLKENVEALYRIIIDMSTTILGHKTSAPIMVAPTAKHKLAHPEGEVATARGAAACDVIMVYKRRDITALMVHRAEKNGFRAIILTADTPRLGRREADIKNKMVAPQLKNFEGLISTEYVSDKGSNIEAFAAGTFDASFCWKVNTALEHRMIFTLGPRKQTFWLRISTWYLLLNPLCLHNLVFCTDHLRTHAKQMIMKAKAIKAIEAGFAGIIVSNHGARQLDYAPATISVLEEVIPYLDDMFDVIFTNVVLAVQGKVPVFFDGGVRRGTDIFKALALGAKAVLIGRSVVYGLAAKGERGVKQVIQMLKNKLELTMALSGCCTVDDITRSHVKTEKEMECSIVECSFIL